MPKVSLQFPKSVVFGKPQATFKHFRRDLTSARIKRLENQEKTLVRAGYLADEPISTHLGTKRRMVSSELNRLRKRGEGC